MEIIKNYRQDECRIIVYDDAIRDPEEVEEIVDNGSRMELQALWGREVKKRREKEMAGAEPVCEGGIKT